MMACGHRVVQSLEALANALLDPAKRQQDRNDEHSRSALDPLRHESPQFHHCFLRRIVADGSRAIGKNRSHDRMTVAQL